MLRPWKNRIVPFAILLFCFAAGESADTSQKTPPTLYPFSIILPANLGQVTQTYFPPQRIPSVEPDFILIQNVHSNIFVQFAISSILKQLKAQDLLPQRIAVEGAVGPVDIHAMQSNPDAHERREIANYLVARGEMPGATHFVAAEGEGDLYGVESADLYESSVDIFRRSYAAREHLSHDLDRMEAALELLKDESDENSRASIIEQDIQVLHRLVDQQLVPSEIHQVMNQAVFAVDHLRSLLTAKKERHFLEPVSAAVDFYALALLRDKSLFHHTVALRKYDHQTTTVLIAGGFHTAGLTRRLKEEGYSYAVITPHIGAYNQDDERLYVQRLLGYPLASGKARPEDSAALKFSTEPVAAYRMNSAETWYLANSLRDKLPKIQLRIPPVQDVFTAMDTPLDPSIKVSLVKQRAEMLSSAEQTALNH